GTRCGGERGAWRTATAPPVVRLERGPDGKLRLPEWRTTPGGPKAGRAFDYEVRIHAGRLLMPEREHSVSGFDLDAAVSTGGATDVESPSLSWSEGPLRAPLP